MNALIKDGRILKLGLLDRPLSYEGEFVEQFIESKPAEVWPNIAILNEPEIVEGNPSYVTQRWALRERTAEERKRVWTALEFRDRVSAIIPGFWKALREMALSNDIAAEIHEQSLVAQEVVSDDIRTLTAMQGCIMLGLVTPEQTDLILNGQ